MLRFRGPNAYGQKIDTLLRLLVVNFWKKQEVKKKLKTMTQTSNNITRTESDCSAFNSIWRENSARKLNFN